MLQDMPARIEFLEKMLKTYSRPNRYIFEAELEELKREQTYRALTGIPNVSWVVKIYVKRWKLFADKKDTHFAIFSKIFEQQ